MPGRIVVGVDGSEHGMEALRWAVREAELRGATLVAVHAWTYLPPAPLAEPGMIPMPSPTIVEDASAEREAADSVLGRALAEALSEAPGVTVEQLVAEGSPGDVLVKQSEGADLVVVGSHGRGGFASALLGSVSGHVAHHAHCPTTIVRCTK